MPGQEGTLFQLRSAKPTETFWLLQCEVTTSPREATERVNLAISSKSLSNFVLTVAFTETNES